ncbi:MAG: DEAD/DEAH box helicase [Fibrobacter sp.]|nr:DEAD/DEAH box helicase [Fibrobacter sp.]
MQTLRDRLSRLSYEKAASLLGKNGKKLLMQSARFNIPLESVEVALNLVRVTIDNTILVSIIDDDRAEYKIRLLCSECTDSCEHKAAALALILDNKTPLALAKPPSEEVVTAELTDDELVMREIARRKERSISERMTITSRLAGTPWTEYTVKSVESGKTYRVDLRGIGYGQSFCSCPDFRKNTLGTCKHIMKVIDSVSRKFTEKEMKKGHVLKDVEIYIRYGIEHELRVAVPEKIAAHIERLFKTFTGKPVANVDKLMHAVSESVMLGYDPVIFPDAEEYIAQIQSTQKIAAIVDEIRKNPSLHPLRKTLLKVELLPYQLDGIAFAAGKGRAVLADDMGLGKTIQAIGTAEFLSHYCDIRKVLIVCPTSLKSQWGNEIRRFCDKSYQQILGSAKERQEQYDNDSFFTICNYEQVMRDLKWIEPVKWDFIILDEGQRIKNWAAKTSRMVKSLQSRYALVLSGTPLENKLDELYSVVEFINERHLGPAFRFYNEHKVVDNRGKATGYKKLDKLRSRLKEVLLRRTRDSVIKQLPPKTTEIIRVVPTDQQFEICWANVKIASQIAAKPYLTEMDLIRLQKALLLARMSCDSTFLVDKIEPSYSSKLEYMAELLPQLCSEPDRKIIVFSEWTTMLDCIEIILAPMKVDYVRLDGSVVQKKRQQIVDKFQKDPSCRLFLTTNAGSTGLNLQSANTVINVDLPWNPAILDQRIGRAYRMGQLRPVHVYLLVTEGTIEERMLSVLSSKKDLALAALDQTSDVATLEMTSNIDDLKKKLEVLLGEKPPAPVDMTMLDDVTDSVNEQDQKDLKKAHEAGGQLIQAAFSFVEGLVPQEIQKKHTDSPVAKALHESFTKIATVQDDGKVSIQLTLGSPDALKALSSSIAMLLEAASPSR